MEHRLPVIFLIFCIYSWPYSRAINTLQSSTKMAHSFFRLPLFAVVGASTDRNKFGNKVFRCYQQNSKLAVPISKRQTSIEGVNCVQSLTALADNLGQYAALASPAESSEANRVRTRQSDFIPSNVGVSIITPPAATKEVIEEGIGLGYRNFFLQPGTADAEVRSYIDSLLQQDGLTNTLNIIHGCVLVEFGFDEHS